ncbi:hypothetical protein AXG89_33550 (plasmid) [Burkholderia sp. PAMC 26561]|nr:hypothetical protein AXG89_33550 [Burkholderia sp. PAMC 26561]
MLTASLSKPVREPEEVLLIDCAQYRGYGLLHNLIFQRCNPQRTQLAVRFRNANPSGRLCTVGTRMNLPVQFVYAPIKMALVVVPRYSVHACRSLLAKSIKAFHQQ